MNQSETNIEGESSNVNSPKLSPKGIDLLGIPHFTSQVERTSQTSSMAPPLCIESEETFEYEFTCIFTNTTPMFIGMWDNDDLSACQRVSACNLDKEEITYNTETGMGFFTTSDGLRWCFKKLPAHRSIGPFHPIGEMETRSRKVVQTSPITADEILSTL